MTIIFQSKDKKTRAIVKKMELKRARLQFFLQNSTIPLEDKQLLNFFLMKSLKNMLHFSVKSSNNCLLTGRSGSVFRYFRLSRIKLKELASRGFLTGVRKSSW